MAGPEIPIVWAFVGIGCCVNCAALWYMFRVTRAAPRPTARVGEEIAIPLLFPEDPPFSPRNTPVVYGK